MKKTTIPHLTAAATLLVGMLFAGCNKKETSSAVDAHRHVHAARHEEKSEARAAGSAAVTARAALSGEKCALHGAPKEWCFMCDPALREKGRMWCTEHARYEDRCWLCHPELQDKSRAWCKEHSLYEDECFLCRPELKTAAPGTQKVGSSHSSSEALMCSEHNVPEEECGICHPELAAKLKPGAGVQLRLASPESARLAGVETAQPTQGAVGEGVECYASIMFNQNKLAQIAAPVGGIIQNVLVDLGAKVEENQPVAKIWSASIAEAVAKAVLSHQTLERERRLRADRVTPEKDLQQAEAEHRAACQQLRLLGFSEEQIDALGGQPDQQVLMEVRAPFAGEIVEVNAVRGALVETGKSLMTVVDRSTMWAMLNIPEASLARVNLGQEVELKVESLSKQPFMGKLTWIAADVDERSRMARARAEVPNPDGVLKAHMFAQARILTRKKATQGMVVPASAIQQIEGNPLVFVHVADDLYQARAVLLGARADGQVEVLEGLKPGEFVAVKHAYPLKSALLISRLGAGCADD